jgi:hypothetical protein
MMTGLELNKQNIYNLNFLGNIYTEIIGLSAQFSVE